jgi:hypothetical protein
MAANYHSELKAAADAARKSLEVLLRERDELHKRLMSLSPTISILQNVVSAWDQMDPQAATQAPLLPEAAPPEPEPIVRGQITEKVYEIMGDKQPRSPQVLHHEIKRRFNLEPSINAVSVALRRGAERGKFDQVKRGEYVLR